MLEAYTQEALDELLSQVPPRRAGTVATIYGRQIR
jgi:hypothetical protein